MNALVSALYAEGRSDERFLPILLQRTLAELLNRHAEHPVDVLDPLIVQPIKWSTREDSVLAAAQQAEPMKLRGWLTQKRGCWKLYVLCKRNGRAGGGV